MLLRPLALLGLIITTSPAMADRAPNQAERQQIETQLKKLGFVSWEEIEFDDERQIWEVDDARDTSNFEFDVDLKPGSLELISKRR